MKRGGVGGQAGMTVKGTERADRRPSPPNTAMLSTEFCNCFAFDRCWKKIHLSTITNQTTNSISFSLIFQTIKYFSASFSVQSVRPSIILGGIIFSSICQTISHFCSICQTSNHFGVLFSVQSVRPAIFFFPHQYQ